MKVPASFSYKLPFREMTALVAVTLCMGTPVYGAEQDSPHPKHHFHHHHHKKQHVGQAPQERAHGQAEVAAHSMAHTHGVAKQHDKAESVAVAHPHIAEKHHEGMAKLRHKSALSARLARARALARSGVADNIGTETKLPLPRFASLRADRVYMRRGPGERYPIDWVYHRRGLPVKIEREFGVWRLVEDPDGQKGWVHQVTLHGSRAFLIPGTPAYTGNVHKVSTTEHADARIVAYVPEAEALRSQSRDVPLMSSGKADQKIIALLQPGTIGLIRSCPQNSSWCHVTVRGYDGWIERRLLWGVQPGEIIQPD